MRGPRAGHRRSRVRRWTLGSRARGAFARAGRASRHSSRRAGARLSHRRARSPCRDRVRCWSRPGEAAPRLGPDADDHGRVRVLVARDRRAREAEQPPGLLGHALEDGGRVGLARDQGRHAPQSGLFLRELPYRRLGATALSRNRGQHEGGGTRSRSRVGWRGAVRRSSRGRTVRLLSRIPTARKDTSAVAVAAPRGPNRSAAKMRSGKITYGTSRSAGSSTSATRSPSTTSASASVRQLRGARTSIHVIRSGRTTSAPAMSPRNHVRKTLGRRRRR